MYLLLALQSCVFVFLFRSAWRDVRWVIGVASPDSRVFERLKSLVGNAEFASVQCWLDKNQGTWSGLLVSEILPDRDDTSERHAEELSRQFSSRLYVLGGVGRLASVTTLLSVVIELSWGLSGGSGLMALQAGLPQQMAAQYVINSLSLGFVSLAFYVWVTRRLRTRMTVVVRRLQQKATELAAPHRSAYGSESS